MAGDKLITLIFLTLLLTMNYRWSLGASVFSREAQFSQITAGGKESDDAKIDGMQTEYGKDKNDFVLESRLGWFNVPDSLKIKLACEDNVRFERTSKQDPERFGTSIEDFENPKQRYVLCQRRCG